MFWKRKSKQEIGATRSVVSDEEWREMLRDCHERSKEWTKEDWAAFGDTGQWSGVPTTVGIVLVALTFIAIAYVLLPLFPGLRHLH
jgi:hypothetical protein